MKRMIVFMLLGLLVLFSGCATTQSQGGLAAMPTTTTAGEVNPGTLGHPFRYAAFLLHPVGVVTDYLLFRPAMFFVSRAPGVFGYTPDDAEAYAKHVGSQ
ncbi:MAG: hypothetical protein HY347_01425 [candidate division NC10 bacterium]|nr:hypothetical protein [candidate division NC10 bacterium]